MIGGSLWLLYHGLVAVFEFIWGIGHPFLYGAGAVISIVLFVAEIVFLAPDI